MKTAGKTFEEKEMVRIFDTVGLEQKKIGIHL
jgi:hypothetical protein